ncbi:MAG: hypothetical protein HY323_08165 [Betaproteobacteria bacterium]|nr:hypothetical protein [Betaproteobacteria bacterium]
MKVVYIGGDHPEETFWSDIDAPDFPHDDFSVDAYAKITREDGPSTERHTLSIWKDQRGKWRFFILNRCAGVNASASKALTRAELRELSTFLLEELANVEERVN